MYSIEFLKFTKYEKFPYENYFKKIVSLTFSFISGPFNFLLNAVFAIPFMICDMIMS